MHTDFDKPLPLSHPTSKSLSLAEIISIYLITSQKTWQSLEDLYLLISMWLRGASRTSGALLTASKQQRR